METIRAGKFFLKKRGAKGVWQICWYEDRQTRTISCRTSDFEVARAMLFKHALVHEEPEKVTDDTLASVVTRYWETYAKHLTSARVVKTSLRAVLEYWPDAAVSMLSRTEQLRYVAAKRAHGLADWTIIHHLSAAFAAMKWAQRDNPDLRVPPMITSADWRPHLPSRERVYTPEELGRIFSVAGRHEHWWRFMVLALATAGREAAIRELRWEQIDTRLGRVYLNPEGRRQTKKRRATVPICPTLAAELASWAHDGATVVSIAGAPLRSRMFFDRLLEHAGVDGSAHVLRHTVRTWMAEQDVPDAQADMFMGHRGAGSHTGAKYTHRKPEYLRDAVASVESLFAAVRPHITGVRLLRNSVSSVTPDMIQVLDSEQNRVLQHETPSATETLAKSVG